MLVNLIFLVDLVFLVSLVYLKKLTQKWSQGDFVVYLVCLVCFVTTHEVEEIAHPLTGPTPFARINYLSDNLNPYPIVVVLEKLNYSLCFLLKSYSG